MTTTPIVDTVDLTFKYPGAPENHPGLDHVTLCVQPGEKFLLVGPNGAGKSTFLKVLAGKKLVTEGSLSLFGINPFDLRNNSALNARNIVYLGTEWANNEITKRDIGVNELVQSVGGDYYIERRDKLIDLLEINTAWRMNRCSDGERRRVQLCMGLLKPFDLLLLDEVTIDLDVLVRQKLLEFLHTETVDRQCAVVYATHIFDGLGSWADHVIHIKNGAIAKRLTRDSIEFTNTDTVDVEDTVAGVLLAKVKSLYPLALSWLRQDRAEAKTESQ